MADSLIPSVRHDILVEIYSEDGKEHLYLKDPKGYASQDVSIPKDFLPLMTFLDGNYRYSDVEKEIASGNREESNELMESLKNLVNFLDYMGYLQSKRFEWIKQDIENYLSSSVRPPYCAGSSYSNDKDELISELDALFSSTIPNEVKTGADSIIVPHIDFRIGTEAHQAYSKAYNAFGDIEPDLVVIFGTSHYGSSKRFILTEKHFETPLGIARNAVEFIDIFRSNITDEDEIIVDEIAHRYEHSIEFQVLLSQFYFKKPFRVLPILVNSFIKDVSLKKLPDEDFYFNGFLMKLNQAVQSFAKRPVFICSVDFAHIGRKFDDDFDASEKFKEIEKEDDKLIHYLASCNADGFFNSVSENDDRYRICGLSPIYTLLKFRKPKESRLLHYHIWNEEETKSAVSFASLAFYK